MFSGEKKIELLSRFHSYELLTTIKQAWVNLTHKTFCASTKSGFFPTSILSFLNFDELSIWSIKWKDNWPIKNMCHFFRFWWHHNWRKENLIWMNFELKGTTLWWRLTTNCNMEESINHFPKLTHWKVDSSMNSYKFNQDFTIFEKICT